MPIYANHRVAIILKWGEQRASGAVRINNCGPALHMVLYVATVGTSGAASAACEGQRLE